MLALESAMTLPLEYLGQTERWKILWDQISPPNTEKRRSYPPLKSEKQVETLMVIVSDEEENEMEGCDIDDNNEGGAADTVFENALNLGDE